MVVVAGENFPDDLACLTCAHVLSGEPVYLVARDAEDGWQFLCNRAHNETDARVIGVGEALTIEPRLSSLAPLRPNESVILPE